MLGLKTNYIWVDSTVEVLEVFQENLFVKKAHVPQKTLDTFILITMFLRGHRAFYFFTMTRSVDQGPFYFIIDMVSNLLGVAALGLVFGGLLAYIPYRDKNYPSKFNFTFPLIICISISLIIVSKAYVNYLKVYKGIELSPLPHSLK